MDMPPYPMLRRFAEHTGCGGIVQVNAAIRLVRSGVCDDVLVAFGYLHADTLGLNVRPRPGVDAATARHEWNTAVARKMAAEWRARADVQAILADADPCPEEPNVPTAGTLVLG